MPSDSCSPQYVVYGLTPDRPLAFTLPPVDATPDQPLPDAGPFLRVCAGVDEPTTVMQRATRELVGVWRHIHQRRSTGEAVPEQLNELLNLYIWCIDQEAGGHTKGIVVGADAPTALSSFGQWAAWLVWRYVLYVLRQNEPEHRERDTAELAWCIDHFDRLVAEVQAGRIRLPEEATDVFPPRTPTAQRGGWS